jgi:hypothetical protein
MKNFCFQAHFAEAASPGFGTEQPSECLDPPMAECLESLMLLSTALIATETNRRPVGPTFHMHNRTFVPYLAAHLLDAALHGADDGLKVRQSFRVVALGVDPFAALQPKSVCFTKTLLKIKKRKLRFLNHI